MKSLFILVLGNTEMVEGMNPELAKLKPVLDAEYLFHEKPLTADVIPPISNGYPTPAIITKAARELAGFPVLVVRGGTYLAPPVPYVHVSNVVGRDFLKGPALPEFGEIIKHAKLLGEELNKGPIEELVIGESTPGGALTARAVLWALGYGEGTNPTSQGTPQSPEESAILWAFKRAGIERGELGNNPLEALRQFGDPTMATLVGLSLGFRRNIVLSGGTQMLAVSAILKALGESLDRFMIATTKGSVRYKDAPFLEMAKELGIITYAADLDFSKSEFSQLRCYCEEPMKEEVGAGGATWLAVKAGFSPEDISAKVEELYGRLTGI